MRDDWLPLVPVLAQGIEVSLLHGSWKIWSPSPALDDDVINLAVVAEDVDGDLGPIEAAGEVTLDGAFGFRGHADDAAGRRRRG